MGDFRLPIRSDYDLNAGEKWDECVLCGTKRTKVLVHFDSGSVAPTVDEVITGATSSDTCIVEGYTKTSGAWADGDAVGVIQGKTPTGYDSTLLEIFQNDEALNGTNAGDNFATVNKIGAVQISGRLIADSDLVEYQGKKYCKPHFLFKFRQTWKDEEKPDYDEGDRE